METLTSLIFLFITSISVLNTKRKFNSIQNYTICRSSFQDYMIFHMILPGSFYLFFHPFPRISSVNKEKKVFVRSVSVYMCLCVCLDVFLIFTENLSIVLVMNRPISAAGLSVCRRDFPCVKDAVIINNSNSRM